MRARFATFFRSFLIQGSWNNRTMIGTGFVFALLPVLRRVYRDDPEGLSQALQRHSEHFNAHPYLSNLALGATCRMESEGRDPEEIRRFKAAVRGPLGSMGDALVWVGWRPTAVLGALLLGLSGATPQATAFFFLIVYNLGHLGLRIWGCKTGWEQGSEVGDSLRAAALFPKADRLSAASVFLLGGVLGLALARSWAAQSWPVLLLAVAGGVWGLWLGSLVGQRVWRWTFWGISGAIGIIFMVGWIG